ncbi:glycosyltransferase family 2 protein [Bradyrhizobium sp. ARR65]|uniref:glycosyltransferase n=1 Tax=Bradyrhizobium sp. ARR65 TaxID=1040989 RepID=UPI0009FE1D76|nr:glycosyltransferase family 2 protein [Bradyrhizobium sp. ARR65]
MISIIIPAHNEAAVIARALANITRGAADGEIDVIVTCNGCTDRTASIARNFGPPVRVIETDIASKSLALNLGDQAAFAFPRIYMDADVVITIDAIRELARRLERMDVLAVAPFPKIDLDDCPWLVRSYYSVRSKLPSAQEGIGGSGVYALSATGRSRFKDFPQLTADDGYIRIQFSPEERETVRSANSTVFPPRTIRDLILIRTRVYYGTLELIGRFPELWRNHGESNHKAVIKLIKSPSQWFGVAVYILVNTLARYRAERKVHTRSVGWERDNSSRPCVAAPRDCTGPTS